MDQLKQLQHLSLVNKVTTGVCNIAFRQLRHFLNILGRVCQLESLCSAGGLQNDNARPACLQSWRVTWVYPRKR